jgi:dTDP-4-dehydrorhamnose reductase
MRLLLIGNTGQLGWELERCIGPLGQVVAVDYPQVNLAEADSVVPLIRELKPDVILNAAAYTAVDRAEAETDLAMGINAVGPGILAEEARILKAALVHYSTDYVFDGKKGSPYVESDATNPLGMYGKSKVAGETAVLHTGGASVVLRTALVYSLRRDSFVTKVLGWARRQPVLRLVDDQVSNPTWARALAEITGLLLAKAGEKPYQWLMERKGIYHLAGDGYASRLAWGQAIIELDPKRSEQVVQEIIPAKTADFPTPAERPLFSALDCSHFSQVFGLRLPPWKDALRLAMQSA